MEPGVELTGSARSSASSQQNLSSTLEEGQQDSRIEKYKEVFTAYFSQLHEALPVELILPKLVSMNVITIDEMAEIKAEGTSSGEATQAQVGVLLYGHIWKGISSGCAKVFTKLLHVMRSVDNDRCEQLSLEISTKLEISTGSTSREFNNHATPIANTSIMA